jgi:hypothetical protein
VICFEAFRVRVLLLDFKVRDRCWKDLVYIKNRNEENEENEGKET